MGAEATNQPVRCVSCGEPLPADAVEGLCPLCLLQAAAGTISADDQQTSESSASFFAQNERGAPSGFPEGSLWGDYRIGRLLGRGGMGDVYEASDLTTGRRVALKVLRHPLPTPQERARFLREGQLAASISHPRTVFVFAAEEHDGLPVIVMELLPGGTLKDRVSASGPMAPADAAEAVLGIIGGLEAAHAAGILHRDVKPSNCFVDHEGLVKIGDFGISISTLARDTRSELAKGGFQGTPQFAAPEQLRGEPLDVRADIYAVGATLYYLLTGRPPFDASHIQTLIERVYEQPPPSPRTLRPAVPPGLAALTVQCLDKAPSRRPQSYAELAEGLRPFIGGDQPAPLGMRALAGVVDNLLVLVPLALIGMFRAVAGIGDAPAAELTPPGILKWGWLGLWLYYAILEGATGASMGKRLFGLRLFGVSGPPSLQRVLLRTSIFVVPGVIRFAAGWWRGSDRLFTGLPATVERPLVSLIATAVLFFTARPRNGWSGVHDLLSATSVVWRTVPARHRFSPFQSRPTTHSPDDGRRIGPFTITRDLGATDRGTLIQAFDPVLRRDVWIHRLPPDTVESTPTRRDLSRITRLRWLTGARDHSAWDAFEAPRGRPLLAVHDHVDWPTLRGWLADLSTELECADREETLPPLTLAHVWVRDDGRVTVLDFPYPTAPDSGRQVTTTLAPIELIPAVATYVRALAPHAGVYPLSLSLRAEEWAHHHPTDMPALCAQIKELARTPDRVTTMRRSIPLALTLVPILALGIAGLAGSSAIRTMRSFEHTNMLWWLDALITPTPDNGLLEPDRHRAAERYVAERFRASLSDEVFWRTFAPQPARQLARHRLARELLDRYQPEPENLQRLAADFPVEIARGDADSRIVAGSTDLFIIIVVSTLSVLVLVVVITAHVLSTTLVAGGAVSRTAGLAIVTPDGREVSRMRSVARTLILWSPALAWCLYLAVSPLSPGGVPAPRFPILAMALTYIVLGIGATMTLLHPSRGPHDALAGVWVVPR